MVFGASSLTCWAFGPSGSGILATSRVSLTAGAPPICFKALVRQVLYINITYCGANLLCTVGILANTSPRRIRAFSGQAIFLLSPICKQTIHALIWGLTYTNICRIWFGLFEAPWEHAWFSVERGSALHESAWGDWRLEPLERLRRCCCSGMCSRFKPHGVAADALAAARPAHPSLAAPTVLQAAPRASHCSYLCRAEHLGSGVAAHGARNSWRPLQNRAAASKIGTEASRRRP